MNARKLTTALLPLIPLPLLLQIGAAGAADQVMDACIDAFVSSNLRDDQPRTVSRVNSPDAPLGSWQDRIVLVATNKANGRTLARAICVVSGNQVVLTMEGRPATRHLAQLGSR